MSSQTPIATHILTLAGGLFASEGIRSDDIDRITDEAEIAGATLYRHFRSKEDPVLAYLQERNLAVLAELEAIAAEALAPQAKIGLIFDRLYERAKAPEFRGCAFGLAVAEHAASDRVKHLARAQKAAVRDLLDRVAPGLGLHLALLYDGALARRAIEGHPGPVAEARALSLFIERPQP
jgi:AcrR family transcriptional regulator